MAQLTPMMQQYMEIKNRHKDKIVFFRLGDFYEMFFDDALTASRVLDITLTGRDCGLKERAPMCGIPYHAADSYIAKLIENNYKVAICEQMEDPALTKNIVKRDVVKIITPGTVTSSIMLDENSNNYLMSIVTSNNYIGISYIDLSTGEYFCTFADKSQKKLINAEINRINPKEVVVNNIENGYEYLENITELDKKYYILSECKTRLKKQFAVGNIEGLGIDNDVLTIACGSLLLYLDEVHKGALKNINKLKFYNITNYMILDQSTRKNLEL